MNVDIRVPTSRLERRARLLLRAYPPRYRADRGEEILGTLLEANAEGRGWPGFRDSRSLLAGGIRARAGRNRAVGLAASLRLAAILGLSLYLAKVVSTWLDFANMDAHMVTVYLPGGFEPQYSQGLHWSPPVLWDALGAIALLVTIAGVWAGLRALVIPAAVAATALQAWAQYSSGGRSNVIAELSSASFDIAVLTYQIPVVLSLVALVVLTRRTGRPPLTWLGLPALPVALFMAQQVLTGGKAGSQRVLSPVGAVNVESLTVVAVLAGIAALAWLITDTRPALAVGLFLAIMQLTPLGTTLQTARNTRWSLSALWLYSGREFEILALVLALTAAMTLLLARRTRPKATIH